MQTQPLTLKQQIEKLRAKNDPEPTGCVYCKRPTKKRYELAFNPETQTRYFISACSPFCYLLFLGTLNEDTPNTPPAETLQLKI